MTGPLRNKQGCWTCRLRKKKCDESQPQCSNCQTLSITCYGFGPKPEWMDNGEKEKAVANSLKGIVRHKSRRKAIDRPPEQQKPLVRIEPKALSVVGRAASDTEPATLPVHEDAEHTTTTISSFDLDNDAGEGPMASISADDSALLVHYIDHVLPLQYPMYQPEVATAGRGWLLALLLRSKPPFHAVLALAANHRCTLTLGEHARAIASVQQEEHLQLSLGLLAQSTQGCPRSVFGILDAIIQVMFFELFVGHERTWQPQLHAVISMFRRGHTKDFARLGLNEHTRWILFADLPIPRNDPAVAQEVVGFRFITSTIVWLDIVASITAGTTPLLVSHHSRILAAGSQIQLRDIMGCDNWVLLQIARIARLYEDMNRTTQQCQDNLTGFEKSASEIRLGLQYSISQITRATSSPVTSEDPHTLITRMFASMAIVYLHLVMHGFQKLDLMDDVLCSSMRIIRTRSGRHLQALVPPLFILGLVAKQEDQQFLRDILSTPPLLDPFLRHRVRLLPILEDIWKRRDTPGFAWHHCVELTKDILLM